MTKICQTQSKLGDAQFSTQSLFEFVTISSVLLAFSPATGPAACVLLILMATALWLKQGALGLFLLMVTSLVAESSVVSFGTTEPFIRQLMVIILATALCGWYYLRRKESSSPT